MRGEVTVDLFAIGWRNIWRNKRRSVLSALAVALSCALLVFMMALQRGSYAGMIDSTARSHTGHVQVQHPDYLEEKDLISSLDDPVAVMERLAGLPRMVALAPRVNAPVLVSAGKRTFGGMLFGIDPAREAVASRMKEAVVQGAWLAPDDRAGVLMGERLARNLGVELGDEVVFLGQGRDGSIAAARLFVRGLYDFGMDELDRTTVAAHIEAVQAAFSMQGAVSEVAVLLEADRYRPAAVEAIKQRLAGLEGVSVPGWPEVMPGVIQAIELDWNSALIMYFVLVLVVGFGIANTFLMAFMERIHEYGVMLSLGMRRGQVGRMAYLESLLLTGVGLVVGLAVGIAVSTWYGQHGIHFPGSEDMASHYGVSTVVYPQVSLLVLGWAGGIVASVSAVMAVYPAVKASRLQPVAALRHT